MTPSQFPATARRRRWTLLALPPILLWSLFAAGGALAQTETAAEAAPVAEAGQTPAADASGLDAESRLPVLLQTAAKAYEEKNYALMRDALVRAVQLRPHLADLRFGLARAHALLDEKTEAYNILVQLDKQGLSFDMTGDPDFENIRGFQLYDYLQEQFEENAEPFGQAETWATIDRTDLLLESLAWDDATGRLFAGSVVDGSVYVVDGDGGLSRFIAADAENGLLGITSMAVDAERGALWVSSAATPQAKHVTREQRGTTYLHRFDLATGEQVARYEPPVRPMLFLDLALAPNGDVYLLDGAKPVVWMLPAEGDDAGKLVPFFAGRGMTGLRSIAVDDSGRQLYFSDYELGIFGVSIANQQLYEVHLGDQLNLGGIDALHWVDDSLLIVQNGVWPRRVLRLGMFPERTRAQHVRAIESNNPSFRNPTAGVVAGRDRFLLIANSHRNTYDPRTGDPLPDVEREPPVILEIDPAFGWNPPPLNLGPLAPPAEG